MFRAHDIFSIWSRKLQPKLSLCLLFSQTRSISDMALIRELESDDPMNSTPAKPKSRSSTIQSRTRKETDEARSIDAEGPAGDENEEDKGEDEENEDEEDEEEYEIEAILDAQRGRIKKVCYISRVVCDLPHFFESFLCVSFFNPTFLFDINITLRMNTRISSSGKDTERSITVGLRIQMPGKSLLLYRGSIIFNSKNHLK